MADDKTQTWIMGIMGTAIVGCYGFIAKHLHNHSRASDLDRLKENVQYRDNCEEIQKRMDERHKEIKEDLKEIKELIKNGGKDG